MIDYTNPYNIYGLRYWGFFRIVPTPLRPSTAAVRMVTNSVMFRPFKVRPCGLRFHHSFCGVESEDQLKYQQVLLVMGTR